MRASTERLSAEIDTCVWSTCRALGPHEGPHQRVEREHPHDHQYPARRRAVEVPKTTFSNRFLSILISRSQSPDSPRKGDARSKQRNDGIHSHRSPSGVDVRGRGRAELGASTRRDDTTRPQPRATSKPIATSAVPGHRRCASTFSTEDAPELPVWASGQSGDRTRISTAMG